MRIGIVGAGMAGLACAEGLAGHGHDVVLLDKGRGPGGRMSTRRIPTAMGDAYFDFGAQYFTIRDEAFRRRVDAWIFERVVAPWPSAGSQAYVGVPTMNAPVRQMANGQLVHWSASVTRIDKVGAGWRLVRKVGEVIEVDMAVIATPAEQASALLGPIAPDLAAHAVPSEPCWTLMLAFSEPLGIVQDCWRGEDVIRWAARNNSKPCRTAPETWVVQAGPGWSRTHVEATAEWVAATLKAAHRWRFARSGAEGSGAILDPGRRLGICGDWLIGPRVEAAWLSGSTLAEKICVQCSNEPAERIQ